MSDWILVRQLGGPRGVPASWITEEEWADLPQDQYMVVEQRDQPSSEDVE
jgi:hypothetical protein